ncbi:MAG: type and secretion system protein family protein, partial [Paucimonas sp.]|nr:type and secretion system protein family protein [Paucimonas sp.]
MQTLHALLLLLAASAAATHAAAAPAGTGGAAALKSCSSVTVDPPTHVTLGKSTVLKLGIPASRMVVGGLPSSRAARPLEAADKTDRNSAPASAQSGADGVADVDITLLSPTELFFLGRRAGSMNVFLQSADGRCSVKDIIVTIDPNTLQAKLHELMPEETGIKVHGAENALVLSGRVSDAVKLDEVMRLATSYGDGKKVVNLLRLTTPQQVMLEVKIAEVSKKLLDRFGIDFARLYTSAGGATSRIVSGILGGGPGVLGSFHPNTGSGMNGLAQGIVSSGTAGASATLNSAGSGATLLGIDAQTKDGLVRVLAEPNIMAISG